MEPILNLTITSLKESATLLINQKAKDLRAQGKQVFHFGFGQSPFPVCDEIQKALADNSHRKEYLPTLGLKELREAFCRFNRDLYGYDFSPECVLVGPGSKELIFQALFVLEGPVLIPAPSWVSYGPQAHIRGKHVHTIQTRKENDYKLQPNELQAACEGLIVNHQKVLILNNPNNPTGTVYHEEEIKGLAEVCREHGVIVISDEIYALTDFSKKPYRGFSRYFPEGTIVTTGLSKGLSAGGYRLGLLAVPKNMESVMHCLKAMVSETFSAVSAPTQYAAVEAFSGKAEILSYASLCTDVHKAAGHYLYERFQKMGVGCVKPEGAFYLFPDFQKYATKLRKLGLVSAKKMADYFLDQLGVAVLPADDFYCPPDFLACRVASVDYDGGAVLEAARNYAGKPIDNAFVEKNCPNLKGGSDALEGFLKGL